MKKSLLLIPFLLLGIFVKAQRPVTVADIHLYPDCLYQTEQGTFVTFYVNNYTTYSWQVSTDQGVTWNTVPSGMTTDYINNNGWIMWIFPPDMSWNGYLYRGIASNASGSDTSSVATLRIVNSIAAAPLAIAGPTEVCQGATVTFTALGEDPADTLWWSAANTSITPNDSIGDSAVLVHFDSSGVGQHVLLTKISNACGTKVFSPAISVSVTVDTLQAKPAATAGSGSSCTTYAIASGGVTSYSDNACGPICTIHSSGSSPVSGTVQSCVTVNPTVATYNGIPYVPRYYNMEPSVNASTSTATVTLYFTQADFNTYNAARGSEPALPAGPTDSAGISNLRVSQFHGSGTTPDTYVGGSGAIDPADSNIVWDAVNSRWSVTFTITGFSGFFVSGTPIVPLPLTLTNFSGQATAAGNLLSWQTASEENTSYFEVQRATAGTSAFEDLGQVDAAGNSSLTRQYSYTDAFSGATHPTYSYRLKMVDLDGRYMYSPIVTLQPLVASLTVAVSPNPFVQPVAVTVGSPVAGTATVVVLSMSGARLAERSVVLQQGDNALDVSLIAGLPQGVYLLQVTTGTQQQTVKFVKE